MASEAHVHSSVPGCGQPKRRPGLSGKGPTVVSYKVDVNRKLILQIKQKSAIENDKPKNKCCKHNDNYLAFTFTFITERKNLSVLFAARYRY